MNMNYETMPIPVEAHQQQIVSASVHVGPNSIATAKPGDWIVKFPDGKLDVYSNEEFNKKFRKPPPPYIANRTPSDVCMMPGIGRHGPLIVEEGPGLPDPRLTPRCSTEDSQCNK